MSEKNEKIKWTCKYCNKPQETTDLPTAEDHRPYAEMLKEAAKNGSIACQNCFRWFMRRR